MGLYLPGGVRWATDGNIPAVGANTQLLTIRAQDNLLLTSQPVLRCYVETQATTLTGVIQQYLYATVIPLFPRGSAALSSAAYPTSNR